MDKINIYQIGKDLSKKKKREKVCAIIITFKEA